MPIKAANASSPYYWTGFYAGGHVGYGRGHASTTLSDPAPSSASNSFGSLFGGVQFGYNYLLTSRVLLGVEADISFPNYLSADDVAASRTTATTDVAHKIDYIGTLRGRLGYVFGRWMVYGTGGLAWTQARFVQTPGVSDDQNEILRTLTGWTAGAGTEVAIAPRWTTRIEYLYSRFGSANVTFPSGTRYESVVRHPYRCAWGSTRKLDSLDTGGAQGSRPTKRRVGQIEQLGAARTDHLHPAGLSGVSLALCSARTASRPGRRRATPGPRRRFSDVRLWQGGEFYFSPELLQGFGLHDTTGAAGFPNGEAQKSNFAYPHYHTSRLFLRQTFGFGGEQETLESGAEPACPARPIFRG